MSISRRPWSAILTVFAISLITLSIGTVRAQNSTQTREVTEQANFFFNEGIAFWKKTFDEKGFAYTAPDLYLIKAGLKVRSNCSGDAPDGFTWLGYPNEDEEDTQGLVDLFYCAAGGGFLDQTVLETPIVYLSIPALIRDGNQVDPNDFDFVTATTVTHELGHDVQFQRNDRFIDNPKIASEDLNSRQTELSADCLAGVWARSVYDAGKMDAKDILEALVSQYYAADPEPLPVGTPGDHGTSMDRVNYWKLGFNNEDIQLCDPSLIDP